PRPARPGRDLRRGTGSGRPGGVRDLPSGGFPPPAGPAGGRVRRRARRRPQADLPIAPRRIRRRRRVARPVPSHLGRTFGGPRHRSGAWQTREEEDMTLDVAHHISEVSRTVGTRTLESGEARVLTASRVYPTDVDDLWDAVTNPDRIARWFLPVSGDLRVGGRYSLQGNADGTIEECEPPNRFAATWEFGGQVSWIEVRIEEEDDGQARFTLEHVAHVDDDMWTQFGPGAVGVGWDGALMGLALHVSNNEAAKPTDLE